jgi:hypothetical protein
MIDDLTRAVELTKARMLEIQAAYMTILINHKDIPQTHEGLKETIKKTILEWQEQCRTIRHNVAEAIEPPDPESPGAP